MLFLQLQAGAHVSQPPAAYREGVPVMILSIAAFGGAKVAFLLSVYCKHRADERIAIRAQSSSLPLRALKSLSHQRGPHTNPDNA
jgi:hypothetical protein